MDGGPSLRTVLAASGAALVAVGLTLVVTGADVRLVSAGSSAQVALDSIAATTGLLLAFLVYGRFRESRSQRDALLCAALLVLGAGNAVLAVGPVIAGGQSLPSASALSGLWAGGLFAVGTWAPADTIDVSRRRRVPLELGALVALVLAGSWGLSALLPREGLYSTDTFGGPDALLTGVQVVAALAFAVTAVGWCRPSVQGDRIAGLLAVAAVLAAVSRVDFALAPSAGSDWVTAGTLLRMGFYLSLVCASVVEIRTYWRRIAEVAVLEERRRIARDLHDGLAQELAFMAAQGRALAEQPTGERAELVAGAAQRALDESRRAIAALTRPLDEPLEASVAQCAEEVCGRFDAALVLDVDAGLSADGDTREALLRILREALSNALRHGAARRVTVRLRGPAPLRLQVEDDGTGFDPATASSAGRFGLVSMRERAESLGGTFAVGRRPTGGTTVEVRLP